MPHGPSSEVSAGLMRSEWRLPMTGASGAGDGELSWRRIHLAVSMLLCLVFIAACATEGNRVDQPSIRDFATRYAAAWCSQDPARVASFFSPDGSLQINEGAPAAGRAEIAAAAQGFMAALPDLVVRMDDVRGSGNHAVFRWTLTGTNTGPGGTGRAVRISGYEEWTMGADGLVAKSLGHFDSADYNRQLIGEATPRR